MIVTKDDIELIIKALNNDEIVSLPTETVMGFGIRCDREKAFQKLIKLKGRSKEKAFPLVLGDINDIATYAYINNRVRRIIESFMPGPITIVLKKKAIIDEKFTNGNSTIAIRIPINETLIEVIKKNRCPIFLTSANKSGEEACLSDIEVEEKFGKDILVVEGKCVYNVASTIIDISEDEIKLIREGVIPFSQIKKRYEEEMI